MNCSVMNNTVGQDSRSQSGVMLGVEKVQPITVTITFGMTMGYLNARIRSRD
jgi:hypothetical protein